MKKIAQIVDEKLRIVEEHFQKLGDSQAIKFILGYRMKCLDELDEKGESIGEPKRKYKKRRLKKRKARIINDPTTVPSITVTTGRSRETLRVKSRFFYGNSAAERKMGLKDNGFTHVKVDIDSESDSFDKRIIRKMVTLQPMKYVGEVGYESGIYVIAFEKSGGGFRIHCGRIVKEHKLDIIAYKELSRNRFPFLTGMFPENCHKFMVK